MSLFRFAILAFLISSSQIYAQEVRWDLVDTGVLNHSLHGKGIEMRIKPDPVPDGLFSGENLTEVMSALCNHFAPSVIPFVKEKAGLTTPNFIAVRVISGGFFGKYVSQAFEVSNDGCGAELEE